MRGFHCCGAMKPGKGLPNGGSPFPGCDARHAASSSSTWAKLQTVRNVLAGATVVLRWHEPGGGAKQCGGQRGSQSGQDVLLLQLVLGEGLLEVVLLLGLVQKLLVANDGDLMV